MCGELLEIAGLGDAAVDVRNARCELVERGSVPGFEAGADLGAEVLVRFRAPRVADDVETIGWLARTREARQGRHQLAQREIAAGPENDDLEGRRHEATRLPEVPARPLRWARFS